MLAELEFLYRTRLPQFRRVAAAIAGDRDAGRDAVQEAFATAIRRRRSYAATGSLEAWVWAIVVNTARDARRRSREHSDEIPEVPAARADEVALPLNLLGERQREIVFLHYYADLGYDAIAEALAISPNTVGAALNAARRTLRHALEEVRS